MLALDPLASPSTTEIRSHFVLIYRFTIGRQGSLFCDCCRVSPMTIDERDQLIGIN
jgi:hypothetical protein